MPPEEKKPEVEQNPAIKEIEAKLTAKKMEFTQLQEKERMLRSQLEKTQHDIIKTAGAYNALVDLKKTLLLQEGYSQIAKEEEKPKLPTPKVPKNLSKKELAKVRKDFKEFEQEVIKTTDKASQKKK